MKGGLILSIFEDKRLGNSSNGGLSSRFSEVTLVGAGGPFEPTEKRPAVKLVARTIGGAPYVHAEPVEPAPEGMIGWMCGGCLVGTSDSRFGRAVADLLGGIHVPAVSLHDRCETPELNEALSR